MPREATGDELVLLRSDGQASKWRAAFFVPHVIYTAVLSGVPSSTDQVAQIGFGSGSGTLANVKKDMLLKVGSTAGGQELGYCRIRKAPIAGTFYIDEQSLIDWSAASPVYLTVVDDFDLFARHVRIDGTTIYMDYDVAFSDQHTTFSPVPVLGPVVRVVKLIEGTADVEVGPEDGHHSWVFGSSISSHNWTSPSGDVSFDDNTLENPTVTVTAPGWHLIYDNVTAANSKARQGVRYIYAWDDDNPPLAVFQVGDFVEDDKNGGVNFSLSFANGVSLADIPDRSLCVLFAEDYYGLDQEQVSIGAVAGAENIIAIGRCISESLSYDDESKTTSIEIAGYQELMRRIHGFPAGVRFKITPAAWTDMPGLTVDKGLYHLLEFHTTAITVMDFHRTGDTRYTAQSFSAFSSIWEQMQQFAFKQILAKSRVDHLGRLFFEIDPNYTPVDDRDYPVVMTLNDGDLTGRVDLPRDFLHDVGQINLSGVVVDNGGNASAFFSLSPGHIPARTGSIDVNDYLLLSDQTQANELAGLIFGAKNNPYKPMRLKLRANNRLVTCFPNQAIAYTVAADKNPRGYAITKNWIPRQRKGSYDGSTGIAEWELVVEAESNPVPAVNGDIPGSSEFTFPPLPGLPSLPSIPVILPGGTGPTTEGGPPTVMVHGNTAGLMKCDNFDAGENEQEWYTINGGLVSGVYLAINRIVVTPSGALYVVRCGGGYTPSAATDIFIYRAPYPGGAFELIEDLVSARVKMSAGSNPVWIGNLACNPLAGESLIYNLWDGSNFKYFSISGGVVTPTGLTYGAGQQDCNLSYGNGKWVVSGGGLASRLWILNAGATALLDTKVHPTHLKQGQTRHTRISTTDKMYSYQNVADDTISLFEDNGAAITHGIGAAYAIDPAIQDNESAFAVDPTGQFILTTRATTGKGRSVDYGATLSDITNLPFTGPAWRFAYAGSALRWVAVSGGGYIYYTDDFFNTAPMDKRGNILDLEPVLSLSNVRVLEY